MNPTIDIGAGRRARVLGRLEVILPGDVWRPANSTAIPVQARRYEYRTPAEASPSGGKVFARPLSVEGV